MGFVICGLLLRSVEEMASFEARKHAVLESLASDARDKSRAGGVDAPIADLIHRINQHPFFFTTSSCSGRVSIFSEPTPKSVSTADDACVEATANSAVKTKKKGGDWVYVSHETASEDEVSHYYCSSFLQSNPNRHLCFSFLTLFWVFRLPPFL